MTLKLYHHDVLVGTISDIQKQMFEMGGRISLTPEGKELRLQLQKYAETEELHDCHTDWSVVDEKGVRKPILLQLLEPDDVVYWRQKSEY